MLEQYLSTEISNALNNIPYEKLCEIRLRANNPIIVNILGQNYYLTKNSYSFSSDEAISISQGVINGIIQRICNNSMY